MLLCQVSIYTLIAFDERVTFWLQLSGQCLVRVRLLDGYTQAYAQIMQHTHTHKAETRRVEAKKLLSRRRQSKYNMTVLGAPEKVGQDEWCTFIWIWYCRKLLYSNDLNAISFCYYLPKTWVHFMKYFRSYDFKCKLCHETNFTW